MWYLGDDRSHFWFYIKAACRRQDLRSCITNIDNIENIRSPVAKVRKLLGDRAQQVSNICQSAYLELRRISSIKHVITVDATKTLVTSLVLSRLDYCNFLLSGIPQQLIDKLQKVQNSSARLIFKTSKCTHVSPRLAKLHSLPIAQRIDYKISSLCYDVVSNTAPLYLSDLLCLYVPSRSLRSSADTRIFRLPTRKKKFRGQRAFSHLGPVTWNKLPYSLRHTQIQSQFKTQLKTTLFSSVYKPDS